MNESFIERYWFITLCAMVVIPVMGYQYASIYTSYRNRPPTPERNRRVVLIAAITGLFLGMVLPFVLPDKLVFYILVFCSAVYLVNYLLLSLVYGGEKGGRSFLLFGLLGFRDKNLVKPLPITFPLLAAVVSVATGLGSLLSLIAISLTI